MFRFFAVVFFGLFALVVEAELVFSPANPVVEVGGRVTLSVSGNSGEVTWTSTKGLIKSEDNKATYYAPYEVGKNIITLWDEVGNASTIVHIEVIHRQLIKPENANWKVFTNRDVITASLLSDDGKILWVGTEGGLEKRDASTEKLIRVFTNLNGLPYNRILDLKSDDEGGIWIRTLGFYAAGLLSNAGGLAHLSLSDELTIYTTENSKLPSNIITVLEKDVNNGLWVGTGNSGLAYIDTNSKWTVYTMDNSKLSSNEIYRLKSDSNGGLWIVTKRRYTGEGYVGGNLIYRNVNDNPSCYL